MLALVVSGIAIVCAGGGIAVGALMRGRLKRPAPHCTTKNGEHMWGPWESLNQGVSVYRPDQRRQCLACGLLETEGEIPRP